MSYRIEQDFEYAGNDYWRWWAWIEADEAKLDGIKEVVWILHPTFKQSRVRIDDRASKFRLKTAGWGTFVLRAEVVLKNSDKQLLKKNLRLEYPASQGNLTPSGPAEASAFGRPLTVFLSYSTQDSRVAAKLRESFKSAGVEVLDQTRIDTGDVWSDALKRMISSSDAVVGLVGDDEISPWVSAEITAAVSSEKPAFVLVAPGRSSSGLPENVRALEIDLERLDVGQIADLVRSKIRE